MSSEELLGSFFLPLGIGQFPELSVRNIGFYKTVGMHSIVFGYIYISVKSRDLNYKLFQHSIRKLSGLEPSDYISIGLQFHRKIIELFLKKRTASIRRNLTVDMQASGKMFNVDFCDCVLSLSNFVRKLK